MVDTAGEEPGRLWREVAGATAGSDYARAYASRFDSLAATGRDVHGEAAFVTGVAAPGAHVLDAGCGTGRVGARLQDLGHPVVGVDVDPAMIEVAGERRPDVLWVVADLAALDLPEAFDVVVAAGNVVPLVGAGSAPAAVAALARHLRPGGLLVAGFGLTSSQLPPEVPLVALSAYDEMCERAGLRLVSRHAGWAGDPYDGGGYAVSVHRAPGGDTADGGD